MIKFDASKLSSNKAYVCKITGQYIYIAYDDGYQKFAGFNAQAVQHADYNEMVRVKIDNSIYKAYRKYYKICEFKAPRLCAINAYDGVIINIESKVLSFYKSGIDEGVDETNWVSKFEKSIPSLTQETLNQNAYINGEQIVWIPKENWEKAQFISNEGEFKIVPASYINLGQIRVWSRNLFQVDPCSTDEDMAISVSSGHIISYSPNDDILVYSPVISTERTFMGYAGNVYGRVSEEERNMRLINSKTNPAYTTLEFVLNSAQTIGKLYGYEANNFLNIPRIIADFGQVNLTKIEPNIRATTPVHISGIDALAWLMGFMYQEINLHNQQALVRIFRSIMRTGLIYKDEIQNIFQDDISGVDDIPLVRWQAAA